MIDLSGMKFHKLKVIEKMEYKKDRAVVWKCLCDCGNYSEVKGTILRYGGTKSCGRCEINEYWQIGEEYILGLTRKKLKFIFDISDYNVVASKNWLINNVGYVLSTDGTGTLLHRFLTGVERGMVVDHINGIVTDNRRINLRICNHNQNIMNQKKQIGTSSIYKGVCKSKGKYSSYLKFNQNRYNLGTFEKEEEAAIAYNKKALEMFGEFARLNEIKGDN